MPGMPVYATEPATGAAQERVSPLPSMTPARGSASLLNTVPPPIDGGKLRGSHSVSAPTGTFVVPPMEDTGKRTPLLFHGRY